MKSKVATRQFLLGFCAFLGVCAQAQEHRLDSLKYILPEFSPGAVLFSDNQFSRGFVNISPMDQGVYCLSAGKDTLFVDRNSEIVSVGVAGRTFIRWRDSFVEVLVRDGDNGIGIIRSTIKINNIKKGAYGMTDATSSIRSYSVDASSGNFLNLIIDDPRNYVYNCIPCLMMDGKFLPVSRKSFEKMFPARKDFIKSVWSERNINVTEYAEVLAFYNELKP